MSSTVQELIDLTRDIMNATGSGQWTDTVIKTWLGTAHWAEWADLLNRNRFYKMQQVNVTQDANGQFTFASLSTGSGDTKKYFYRILSVAQPATPATSFQYYYKEVTYDEFPNPQPNTILPYVWYRFGDVVQVLPSAAGLGLTVTTNWRPTRVDRLSATSITVDFPEGYEEVIAWRAAVLALNKGGSESQAGRDITDQYDTLHDKFLDDLGRQGTWPTMVRPTDMREDWG